MNSISSSYSNGATLLEVGMPTQLSGASPTTYAVGSLIWKHFMQTKNEQPRKQAPAIVKSEEDYSAMVPSRPEYSQLHLSACLGQVKLASRLLENSNPDLNKQDHNGNTPLIWAASEGNEELVQLLVDSLAHVNIQNFTGETALLLAAARGFEGICALLLENGANPNIANCRGETPLHLAVSEGQNGIAMLLLSHGAYVNCQDDEGDTPLHFAVREEQLSTVEMLVTRCNASVDIENDDRESPLELASCLECTEMVQFLSKFASKGAMDI